MMACTSDEAAVQNIASLASLVRHRAQEAPTRTAISFGGRGTSFGELNDRSNRVAQGLRASGVSIGDRVAILDRNGPEHFDVMFGSAKAGATYLPINWRLAPDEVGFVLTDSGAQVLFLGREFLPMLESALITPGRGPQVVVLDAEYDAWIAQQAPADTAIEPTPDSIAFQMYTSGTTGAPKGVMLSHRNLCGAAELTRDWQFDDRSVSLVCMPLFHMSGTSWAFVGLYHGARIILLRDPDPARMLRVMPDEHVTHALVVPAVMQMIVDDPAAARTDFGDLRLMVYGGSPISQELLAASLSTFDCDFMQLYGLTESTGLATVLDPADHHRDPRLLRSVGKPAPTVELRTVDPLTGQSCGPGVVGEIWIRSPAVMEGYWQADGATAEVLDADGWLRTGDAGYLDEDGYLFLQDRVKDMIVSGGENVYPAEVESALRDHRGVADVAVVGVPEAKWGETVKAVVVRRAGHEPSEQELIEFARGRIAHYKCPTSVDFVADLPRNATGKVLKRQVREPYWQGLGRRIN